MYNKKTRYSDCELYGAEVVFQMAMEESFFPIDKPDFYVCDEWIYYSSESYGEWITIDEEEGELILQRLTILESGMLVAQFNDNYYEEGNEYLYRVEWNNLTRLNIHPSELTVKEVA